MPLIIIEGTGPPLFTPVKRALVSVLLCVDGLSGMFALSRDRISSFISPTPSISVYDRIGHVIRLAVVADDERGRRVHVAFLETPADWTDEQCDILYWKLRKLCPQIATLKHQIGGGSMNQGSGLRIKSEDLERHVELSTPSVQVHPEDDDEPNEANKASLPVVKRWFGNTHSFETIKPTVLRILRGSVNLFGSFRVGVDPPRYAPDAITTGVTIGRLDHRKRTLAIEIIAFTGDGSWRYFRYNCLIKLRGDYDPEWFRQQMISAVAKVWGKKEEVPTSDPPATSPLPTLVKNPYVGVVITPEGKVLYMGKTDTKNGKWELDDLEIILLQGLCKEARTPNGIVLKGFLARLLNEDKRLATLTTTHHPLVPKMERLVKLGLILKGKAKDLSVTRKAFDVVAKTRIPGDEVKPEEIAPLAAPEPDKEKPGHSGGMRGPIKNWSDERVCEIANTLPPHKRARLEAIDEEMERLRNEREQLSAEGDPMVIEAENERRRRVEALKASLAKLNAQPETPKPDPTGQQ